MALAWQGFPVMAPPRRHVYMVRPDPESAGAFLREHRERFGWTQKELAERAMTRQNQISQYETGRTKNPDEDVLERLDAALGLERGTLHGRFYGEGSRRHIYGDNAPPGSIVIPPEESTLHDVVEKILLLNPEETRRILRAIQFIIQGKSGASSPKSNPALRDGS